MYEADYLILLDILLLHVVGFKIIPRTSELRVVIFVRHTDILIMLLVIIFLKAKHLVVHVHERANSFLTSAQQAIWPMERRFVYLLKLTVVTPIYVYIVLVFSWLLHEMC